MTATSKTTTPYLPATSGQISPFTQMVKAVFASVLRRWALLRNRQQVMRLNELDTHILRDIGLHRGDIYTAIHHHGAEDPTHLLRRLADAQQRIEATRHIC